MSSVKKVDLKEKELSERQTPWKSVYVIAFLLLLVGVQMSIYFTSTWQYLSENDETATVDFFGTLLALQALSSAIANPLFGHWNQISNSTRKPIFCAFGVATIGNFVYGFSYLTNPFVKWVMLFSRILCGFSQGALGVLRSFIGTASTKEDRMKAVSITNAGFTAGFFLGPTIQICFIPIGKEGFTFGPLLLNMYTAAAFFMTIISIFSILLTYFCLEENYVGIISKEDKTSDPYFVLPKFDRLPVILLFYMWWLLCGVVCVESMSAPVTIAMYNWSREDAVLYNGIIQTVSCVFTFAVNFSLASTRLKFIDNRKLILVGLLMFEIFFVLHMPLPFYPGPLDRPNSTIVSDGMCDFDCRLFELSGYKYIMMYHWIVVTVAAFSVILLWRRLVPLKLTPSHGEATRYKLGTFYRM
uniref:Major facilitator superfamily (MFS) profile domain-containing protein n=1 Tax=Caenorhabditis japonica TaxID=281687 RepID=A0A8R1DK84_CAEJA